MTLSRTGLVRPPAKSPCDYCPYRRDVPSGVWAPSEYAKLPDYDRPTGEQPPGLFMCHKQNTHTCAGWAGCHGPQGERDRGYDLLALRFAGMFNIPEEVIAAIESYVSPVPLFATALEAAEHGLRDVEAVGEEAVAAMDKLDAARRLRRRRRGEAG